MRERLIAAFWLGRSMGKRTIIAVGSLLAAVIVLLLFQQLRNSGNESILIASGTVEVTEVDLGFKMSGRIVHLSVEEGQTVESGDRLAALDDAELRSMTDQARAALRNAEAELERASKDFERVRQLAQEEVVSVQQLDAATRNRAVAVSQRDQAMAALQVAKVRLADAALVAPMSGVVLERNAEPGENVAAGRTVYTIGDLEAPWIKVYIRETKLGLVKLGQTAEVTVDTFPGKIYSGKVSQIASEAEFTPKNVQTREERVKLVFGVKVNVQNENSELKPGMPADVKIIMR
jgi:HlyD family secretion protein